MNQIVSGVIVAVVASLLAVGAMSYGNSAALDGLSALSRKYQGRCIGLADGRLGTIGGISAKSIRVNVRNAAGAEEIVSVKRVPDLDRFLVGCPVSAVR